MQGKVARRLALCGGTAAASRHATPLVAKLQQFVTLSEADKQALEQSVRDIRSFSARQEIIAEGARPDHVHLILRGWAGRYKCLANGSRQMLAYLLPGDYCDVQVALLQRMDHSIAAVSPARVAFIPRETIRNFLEEGGPLSRAIWWSTLVDEAILREWLLNIGQRPADRRLAHLFCEMALRGRPLGWSGRQGFDLPLTQADLAEAMGLTTVHINRTMMTLRAERMIEANGRRLIIQDLPRLMDFCDFDASYLHQEGLVSLRPSVDRRLLRA